MRRRKGIIFLLAVLLPVSAALAQTTDADTRYERILSGARSLASDQVFSQASVGICVRTADGQEIAGINSQKMLIPASNMKLITTGAALFSLGVEYRFRTAIAYSGHISDGTLHGNIHIIGGADPTLASSDSIATSVEATFRQWGKMLKDAGIRRIDGFIIGDGRWFDGASEESTWLWEDLGTYYGAGSCGLMFNENMTSFTASPGKSVGAPVDIKPYYPLTPWMDFRYSCTTGENGTGDRIYMYTSRFAPVAELRGTLGADVSRKRIDCSNKFPEYTCAEYFREYLSRIGIECTKGAGDCFLATSWTESMPGGNHRTSTTDCARSLTWEEMFDGLTFLGETFSPSLKRIAFETNHESNNVYAETLFRIMGKVFGASAGYSCCAGTLLKIIGTQGANPHSADGLAAVKGLGIDTSRGISIKDGSGLSRADLVSPDFFCRFLEAMEGADCFEEYLNGLPQPGGNGTLAYNMRKYPVDIKNRIRVKSGSMSGVRCYSGYILPPDGNPKGCVTFSVMTNNCTAPAWKVTPVLERFLSLLAENAF